MLVHLSCYIYCSVLLNYCVFEITPYFCNSMHARLLNCIVLLELKSTCLCTNCKNEITLLLSNIK